MQINPIQLTSSLGTWAWAMEFEMTPFIVTNDEERRAALKRIEFHDQFPPVTPEAMERQALLEAIELFETSREIYVTYIEDKK